MSRILVVEDEQHIADGLRFNMEAEGHEVIVATDGGHDSEVEIGIDDVRVERPT